MGVGEGIPGLDEQLLALDAKVARLVEKITEGRTARRFYSRYAFVSKIRSDITCKSGSGEGRNLSEDCLNGNQEIQS